LNNRVASTVSVMKQVSASKNEPTPSKNPATAMRLACRPAVSPRNSRMMVMPMKKAQAVSKRNRRIGQVAPAAQGQQFLHRLLRGLGFAPRSFFHHPRAVDDAGQSPRHHADHAGHRREQKHRRHRQLNAMGDGRGIKRKRHGQGNEWASAALSLRHPHREIPALLKACAHPNTRHASATMKAHTPRTCPQII
jgi:hypothetical protein